MKRKITISLACLLSLTAFGQQENEDRQSVNIDWKEDSTEVTTIKDIIDIQERVTSRNSTERHYASVWGKRGYFNISYNTTTLSPKENIATGVSELNGGQVPEFKSDWGVSIQYGRSYRLHKKPIANLLQFNIDYTGIDLNVNHFKAEGNGKNLYNSGKRFAYKSDSCYYTPWNLEKYEINYGMSLGPSLSIAPFNTLNSKELHYLKLNFFYHIGYHVSVLYMPNDVKADINQDTSSAGHKTMKDNLKLDWGHGLINSFGLNLSWKAIGVGYEHRTGSVSYKSMNTGDFSKQEYDFKSSTSRAYLQIRM